MGVKAKTDLVGQGPAQLTEHAQKKNVGSLEKRERVSWSDFLCWTLEYEKKMK